RAGGSRGGGAPRGRLPGAAGPRARLPRRLRGRLPPVASLDADAGAADCGPRVPEGGGPGGGPPWARAPVGHGRRRRRRWRGGGADFLDLRVLGDFVGALSGGVDHVGVDRDGAGVLGAHVPALAAGAGPAAVLGVGVLQVVVAGVAGVPDIRTHAL